MITVIRCPRTACNGRGLAAPNEEVRREEAYPVVIQTQLKLRLNKTQEAQLEEWLWHLTGVTNWAIRKIELDAKDGIYYSAFDFQNLLAGHSKKLDIPSHVLQAVLGNVRVSWSRCFKKLAKKPQLKGQRNKLTSIPFSDPIRSPIDNRITLLGLGSVRFHKQDIPEGPIKCGRIVKRASGWYLCLFIAADSKPIPHKSDGLVGIDPGFKHLLTLSTGEKIDHPRELEAGAQRLAQAQRGKNKKQTARLRERQANRRKDRNHKLSRQLVENHSEIYFSKDNYNAIAKKFGKSVTSSSHAQLRSMLAYKCTKSDRRYVEVASKNSTRTCSKCAALTGPVGWVGLKVRFWVCSGCGTEHDRDVNAALNTLLVGAGLAHEVGSNA